MGYRAKLVHIAKTGLVDGGEYEFETVQELEKANEELMEKSGGLIGYEWDGTQVAMCEMCNRLYDVNDQVVGGRTGHSGFCSDDCKQEADDEIRMWDCEDRRQAEMYGDDLDSWYR